MKIPQKFVAINAVMLSGFAAGLRAQPQSLTNETVITTGLINAVIDEARTNNPALKAADLRVHAATLNAEAVRTWADPSGAFGGGVYGPKGFKPEEEGDLAYGVEEKLPLWNRPKLTRRVAEAETSLRQAELNFAAHQLRGDIVKALLSTALAEELLKIGTQDLAWLETVAQSAENKYRSGLTSIADSLQTQNEVATRQESLRTDRQRLEHEHLALNRLLNRDAGSSWPPLKLPEIASSIPLSQKLLDLALANEPKLKMIEQEIKQAAASAQLTRNMRLPDVSLGIEGRQFSGDGEFRSGMFTMRFSLPWFNSGKYAKEYQRDYERHQAAIQDHEDRALLVREELHHLAVEIDAARRQAVLQGGDIVLRSQQALNSRLADWETGRGTLRDVLDARRTVLESKVLAARATAEEHGMLADMVVWTGAESLEALELLSSEPPLLPHDPKQHPGRPQQP